MKIMGAGVVPASAPFLFNPVPVQVIMNSFEFLTLGVALIPYLFTHALIIAMLLRLRRGVPAVHRRVSRWMLFATALPMVGPFLSAFALARLARDYQAATARLAEFRSDCGHTAGIGYGLIYAAATWSGSAELGLLSLALLVLFFCQAWAARRALIQPNPGPLSPLPSV